MYRLNGQVLYLDMPFEHNDTLYPANWLRLSTPEDRAAIGITEFAEQMRPDDRYYYVSANQDGTYGAIPRDIEPLKQQAIAEINNNVSRLLSGSDWRVIKAWETGTDMPDQWREWRAKIRQQGNDAVKTIQAFTTMAEIQAWFGVSWPPAPTA